MSLGLLFWVFSSCLCHWHCIFVVDLMSPHHCDQMSQRSQFSSFLDLKYTSAVLQYLILSQVHFVSCPHYQCNSGNKQTSATIIWDFTNWIESFEQVGLFRAWQELSFSHSLVTTWWPLGDHLVTTRSWRSWSNMMPIACLLFCILHVFTQSRSWLSFLSSILLDHY